MSTISLVSLGLTPITSSRKGFKYVRKGKKKRYDEMSIMELKQAYRDVVKQLAETGKVSLKEEAEYISQNISYIQLVRGVI